MSEYFFQALISRKPVFIYEEKISAPKFYTYLYVSDKVIIIALAYVNKSTHNIAIMVEGKGFKVNALSLFQEYKEIIDLNVCTYFYLFIY